MPVSHPGASLGFGHYFVEGLRVSWNGLDEKYYSFLYVTFLTTKIRKKLEDMSFSKSSLNLWKFFLFKIAETFRKGFTTPKILFETLPQQVTVGSASNPLCFSQHRCILVHKQKENQFHNVGRKRCIG